MVARRRDGGGRRHPRRAGRRPGPLGSAASGPACRPRLAFARPDGRPSHRLAGARGDDVGWFGFNPSVAGAGLGRLGNLPDRAGMVIFATIMLAVAWHGLNVLSWTALAAGLATVLLAAEGVHLALSGRTGPLLGDGHPAAAFGQLPAIAIMVGYGAAFALRTPDFTHDLARPRHVVWCAAVGLALPHRRSSACSGSTRSGPARRCRATAGSGSGLGAPVSESASRFTPWTRPSRSPPGS